jgi:hypothetical protein
VDLATDTGCLLEDRQHRFAHKTDAIRSACEEVDRHLGSARLLANHYRHQKVLGLGQLFHTNGLFKADLLLDDPSAVGDSDDHRRLRADIDKMHGPNDLPCSARADDDRRIVGHFRQELGRRPEQIGQF